MHKQSVAIYTNNISDMVDHINRIKLFFQNEGFNDFVIFTDQLPSNIADHGALTTFYMVAYRGIIIFCNVEDYLEHKDNLICDTALYLPKYDYSIDRDIIKQCDILTNDGTELKWIKKYELQRTI